MSHGTSPWTVHILASKIVNELASNGHHVGGHNGILECIVNAIMKGRCSINTILFQLLLKDLILLSSYYITVIIQIYESDWVTWFDQSVIDNPLNFGIYQKGKGNESSTQNLHHTQYLAQTRDSSSAEWLEVRLLVLLTGPLRQSWLIRLKDNNKTFLRS